MPVQNRKHRIKINLCVFIICIFLFPLFLRDDLPAWLDIFFIGELIFTAFILCFIGSAYALTKDLLLLRREKKKDL